MEVKKGHRWIQRKEGTLLTGTTGSAPKLFSGFLQAR